MGITTSPQQQNPQTGADKDPCEVLLSMLCLRLFTTKSHVIHDRMAYQECQEFLASQGRKDNMEKMELRGSLVSRDRGVLRMMGWKKDEGYEG